MTDAGNVQPLQLKDVTVTDEKTIKRAVGAAAIGNFTEWYDFGVYSYLAATISKVFFSGLPHGLGVVATLATFAASFLIRPFGGMIFGPLGDRIGRTKVLSVTVILMAAGTCLIGFVPSYASIGVAAPLLVLLLRLIQGVSTGGEYGGAMTFIAEYAPDRRRGFFGSWLEFGTLTGYAFGALLSTGLGLVLTDDQLISWGWRIPFIVALPIGLIGVYLRLKLEETPAFKKLLDDSEESEGNSAKGEFKSIFVDHWRSFLLVGGLVVAWNVTNYMLTAYMPTYLTTDLPDHGHQGTSENTSQVIQVVVLFVSMAIITFLGRFSDKVGRKPVLMVGSIALIVLAFPSIALLRIGGTVPTLIGLLIMGLTLICFASTCPSTLPAMFPTHIRYGGLAIAFNIFVSLFCGTTAPLMSGLVYLTGDLNWPAYYLVLVGIVGVVCTVLMKDPAKQPLPGSPPAVATEEEARELVGAGAP